MGNDIDHSQKDVVEDLQHWARWIVREVGISGFRLDAVKHMSQSFLRDWIQQLDNYFRDQLFFVGEYWRGDIHVLGPVIEKFRGRLHLFDVALAGNLSNISHNPESADLRKVFNDTLMKHYPGQAVVSSVCVFPKYIIAIPSTRACHCRILFYSETAPQDSTLFV